MFSLEPPRKLASCLKCRSAMISDRHEYHNKWVDGLRCINCGERAPWTISRSPERPVVKKWERACNILDPEPKVCGECGVIFTPHRKSDTHCKGARCRYYWHQRTGYMGGLVSVGMAREEARQLAFKKYPRLRDKSTFEIVGVRPWAILTAIEEAK